MNRSALHAAFGALAALALSPPASALALLQRADAALAPTSAAVAATQKMTSSRSTSPSGRPAPIFVIFDGTEIVSTTKGPAPIFVGRTPRPTFERLLKLRKSLRAEFVSGHTDPALR